MALAIGVFFLLYGAYARWLAAEEHPLYAVAAWTLGAVWLVLAYVSGRPPRE